MKKKGIYQTLLIQFFICYTFTMLTTTVFVRLDTPPVTELPVVYLWQVAGFSLLPGIPTLLFYTNAEQTHRRWWVRTVLHTATLEVLLMAAGYWIGMYEGVGGAVAFFVAVLLVDGLVHLFTYLSDRDTANKINRKIAQRRGEKTE